MTFTIEQLEYLRDRLDRYPPRSISEMREAINPNILTEFITEKKTHQALRSNLERFVYESTHRIFEDADEYGDGWNQVAINIAKILGAHH